MVLESFRSCGDDIEETPSQVHTSRSLKSFQSQIPSKASAAVKLSSERKEEMGLLLLVYGFSHLQLLTCTHRKPIHHA